MRKKAIQVAGYLCILTGVFAPSQFCAAEEKKIDYGADAVNSMAATKGIRTDGREDYSYLALENHYGPSGVPVGGIGAGYFDYAPDGSFSRVAINNWQSDGVGKYAVKSVPGSFVAVWRAGKTKVLRRGAKGDEGTYAGMNPARNTVYKGVFPIAECRFDHDETVRVWSGLTPQNVKDSSLPLAWVEVEVSNPSAGAQEMAVAFSWQDVIGREIRDIRDPELLASMAGQIVWKNNAILKKAADARRETWVKLPRVATTASAFADGGFTGVLQHSAPLEPMLKTFQNYNNEIVVAAESLPGAEITTLPAFDVDAPDAAWTGFRQEGRFAKAPADAPLFDLSTKKEMASAVAVRVKLEPGEKRTVRFLISWFQPEMDLTKALPGSYFGKADYGRYFMNSFKTLSSLVTYAGRERERIERETRSWQTPILESTYPDWLKFKLINSAYTLYTNTMLNKAGDFSVMEGGMGGLAGTMDQRISAHPFYFKFMTPLDRSDLELFGHTKGSKGQILHFDAHYYFGFSSRDGTTQLPDNCMNDNSGGWLLQAAKDYQQSGDLQWLSQFHETFPKVLDYLRSRVASKKFQIISGSTTYDDFWHPNVYAYNATTWPAFLKAGAVLHRAFGEKEKAEACERESIIASNDAMRALWNGRYFAYGANLDGSERRDDIMFSGQLGGQFMSRCFGLGDVLPMDITRASLVAQFKTNISHSRDYYAPKVWSIKEAKAMNDPRRPKDPNADSTCWPFYLESYTAMAAIQAGYVEDGLEIMRHIQLLNLRNGWTWSQNLWRPGELTYVTAPVTWFITDVLAGAGLDVPSGTLTLGPIALAGETKSILPVYFPRFWGTIQADSQTHSLKFQVTRVFGDAPITLRRIVALPVGVPSDQQKVIAMAPFEVKAGAVLDLSAHWNDLMAGRREKPVLPDADKTPFLEVPLPALQP